MTSLNLLSGIREGGDIPAGSAGVWRSPGSRGLLHLPTLVPFVQENKPVVIFQLGGLLLVEL